MQSWRQAIELHPPAGLLPDDTYIPAAILNSHRRHYQLRWFQGLRYAGEYLAEMGHLDEAAHYWDLLHNAEPWDQEAHAWLLAYYRQRGWLNQIEVLQQRRQMAE